MRGTVIDFVLMTCIVVGALTIGSAAGFLVIGPGLQ